MMVKVKTIKVEDSDDSIKDRNFIPGKDDENSVCEITTDYSKCQFGVWFLFSYHRLIVTFFLQTIREIVKNLTELRGYQG
ncbi:hypothetical protein ABEB36_006046 [Hypothenemus hampei]|uniref:Uncharacterized protein n=1 Tax=Hypothenemus hampei TaxID=57062 RepID=A0ABD1F0B6_HYPHA